MARKLLGFHGAVNVRDTRAAADAPNWTPDNAAGEAFDNVTFDADITWENVRLVAVFNGGALDGAGSSVGIEPLIEVKNPASPTDLAANRKWAVMPAVTLDPLVVSAPINVEAKRAGFRITSLLLAGGATSVTLRAVPGELVQGD